MSRTSNHHFHYGRSTIPMLVAPKVLYDQLANTYGGLQKACHVYYLLFILTFVWLFGALVSMRAIDYDLQEIFWDLAVYEKVFKKIFRERARPGDGRSNTSSDLRSGKNQIWRDTGPDDSAPQTGYHDHPGCIWDGLGSCRVGLGGVIALRDSGEHKSRYSCARMEDQRSNLKLWQRRTGAGGANQVPWAGSSRISQASFAA